MSNYERTHATTIPLGAAVSANRFIGYNGAHASAAAGGGADSQGVSLFGGNPGESVSVITGYSAPVTTAGPIPLYSYVKPAADGSGRAVVGTAADHCGRALAAASGDGELIEVQVLHHVHP
jgi:hypothetical protein